MCSTRRPRAAAAAPAGAVRPPGAGRSSASARPPESRSRIAPSRWPYTAAWVLYGGAPGGKGQGPRGNEEAGVAEVACRGGSGAAHSGASRWRCTIAWRVMYGRRSTKQEGAGSKPVFGLLQVLESWAAVVSAQLWAPGPLTTAGGAESPA